MMKQMTQSSEDDALWSIQVPAAILKECQDELVVLQKWKEEQLAVEATWDAQAVGNELGLLLGSPIRPQILPAIKELRQMVRELRDALQPFLSYSASHGASNLQGRNGAYIKASDWLDAYKASNKANQLLP